MVAIVFHPPAVHTALQPSVYHAVLFMILIPGGIVMRKAEAVTQLVACGRPEIPRHFASLKIAVRSNNVVATCTAMFSWIDIDPCARTDTWVVTSSPPPTVVETKHIARQRALTEPGVRGWTAPAVPNSVDDGVPLHATYRDPECFPDTFALNGAEAPVVCITIGSAYPTPAVALRVTVSGRAGTADCHEHERHA